MKKRVLVVLLALFVCLGAFGACSNSDGKKTQSEIASGISSTVSKVTSDVASVASIAHQIRENLEDWTYEDWQVATQEQREACAKFFGEKLSQAVTVDNLGKIFGTNQDKNLSQIIENQKEILNSYSSSTQSAGSASVQPDPGHGAAAGY